MIRQRLLPLMVGFVVIAGFILAVATKPRPHEPESETLLVQSQGEVQHAKSESRDISSNDEEQNFSPVERFVRQESQKVGRADPDPDASFQRLKRLAINLRTRDIEALKSTALNQEIANDQRFLSVYLLALNASQAAMPALMGVALSPLTIQDVSSRLYAEELMIRTQALEGLAKVDGSCRREGAMAQFLRRQDNAFLADQARRLLSSCH